MRKLIKWAPIALALLALLYSVGLGLLGHVEEAQYSSHWPATLLLFYLAIEKIRE
jgi:hypothetical protein